MNTDWLGNPVTTDNPATLQGIDDFGHGFLAYEEKALNILGAADADPDCALANAYAAMLFMFSENRQGPGLATPFMEKAEARAAGATKQEQHVIAAIRAWVDNDIPKAIALTEDIANQYPHELAIIKAGQYHQFNLGNSPGMLRLINPVRDANADNAYVHGMTAFALEQCHRLADAEAAAWKAVDLQRKEPWAHHALAHIMLTQGRIEEGMRFFDDVRETWTDLNSFMYTHNWWHDAVFQIARGNYDAALKMYDEEIWGKLKDYSQDQIGAVSLLARLELVGVDVGDRWHDVADFMKDRVDDHVQPFLTMQYVYGLARAGRDEADKLLESLGDFAPNAPAFQRQAWHEVALPACKGLVAHARGDWQSAVDYLRPLTGRWLEIGGSHAQRDLFDLMYLDALIKSSGYVAAYNILELRKGWDADSVPNNQALAMVSKELNIGA
jgi:tetratricopeptide (TPR) repeat protein